MGLSEARDVTVTYTSGVVRKPVVDLSVISRAVALPVYLHSFLIEKAS